MWLTWKRSWFHQPPLPLWREHAHRLSAELSSSSPRRRREVGVAGGRSQDHLQGNPLHLPHLPHLHHCCHHRPNWVPCVYTYVNREGMEWRDMDTNTYYDYYVLRSQSIHRERAHVLKQVSLHCTCYRNMVALNGYQMAGDEWTIKKAKRLHSILQ